MDQSKMLYNITFTLTIDDYYNYNKIVYAKLIHKNQRRQTILGILAVLVAAFVLSTFLITSEFEILFIILDIILIFFGIISIIYYPMIFSKKLKQTSIRDYKENNLAYEKITLAFSNTHIIEQIEGKEPRILRNWWSDLKKIFIYDEYTILMFEAQSGIYIPSRILDRAYDAKLKTFIITKAEDEGVKILYEK